MGFEDVLEEGIREARRGRYKKALGIFDRNILFTMNPTAMSYYAMSLAAVEGEYDRAISLCLMAAEKEFYNPEIYLNLGRVLLMSGRKTKAIKAFKKGLKYDGAKGPIIEELKKLGIRRQPTVSFLPRKHFINRFFGRLTARISGKAVNEL